MLKLQLARVTFLSGLLLAACQAPTPGIGNSPLSAPVGRGPTITCTIESAQNYPDIPLDTVRVTTDYVFVSTENGLYRATLNERRWSYLNCPNNFPRRGYFANYAHETDPIILITDQGLFSTSDNGDTWHLVSNAYNFPHAFVHPDGTLYAIAKIPVSCAEPIQDLRDVFDFLSGTSWKYTCLQDIIVMSSDFGQNWHDITGNTDRRTSFHEISQDPDHPDLVIVSMNRIRGYVRQATDKSYRWQTYQMWEWEKNHAPPQRAFYDQSATLNSYFDYQFGKQEDLPQFDILTEQKAYTFAPTDGKIIMVTIKFLPTTGSDQLVDLKDSVDLWGVRMRDSTGHSVEQLAKLTQSITATTSDRISLMWQYRSRPDFYRTTINHAQVYTKLIDLDNLLSFSTSGIYQVQFIYDNTAIAGRDQGEWIGSFASNVFTVTITAP